MNDLKEYYLRSVKRFNIERKEGKITVTDTVKKETIVFDDNLEGKLATIRYVRDNSN